MRVSTVRRAWCIRDASAYRVREGLASWMTARVWRGVMLWCDDEDGGRHAGWHQPNDGSHSFVFIHQRHRGYVCEFDRLHAAAMCVEGDGMERLRECCVRD